MDNFSISTIKKYLDLDYYRLNKWCNHTLSIKLVFIRESIIGNI